MGGYETVPLVTALANKLTDKNVKFAERPMCRQPRDKTMNAANETVSVAQQLRPLVMMVAAFSFAVAALLVTTASLGASPINSMEVASLD